MLDFSTKSKYNHMSKNASLTYYLTKAGIIAAVYAALTLLAYPISFGAIQLRPAEALTVLPMFFPEAVPGLFVGCIISNLLSPNIVALDVVFGSLATFGAAYVTSKLKSRWLAPIPPALFNGVIVGIIITISLADYNSGSFGTMLIYNMLTVGLGELAVCYILGVPLTYALDKLFKRKTKMKGLYIKK